MDKKEILQRIFYIDKIYTDKRIITQDCSDIKSIIKSIKESIASLSIAEIENKLTIQDLHYFHKYHEHYCEQIEVDLGLLCIDDSHGGREKGTKLLESSKMKSEESLKRIASLTPIVNVILSEIPIIVQEYDKMFEVLLGNHRAACLIKRGDKRCKVLVVRDGCSENSFSGISFL